MSKPPPPPPQTIAQMTQSIPLPQTSGGLSQAPPKPPQLLPNQQQQLEQQLHQLQLQQQQQQSVMNPQPFVLNESQRQALHNLIVRQQQEAQQLAQQTTLPFPQLQLTAQQQEQLLQVCVSINPFPSKPWFLGVCSKSLLKTLWEKEKKSNFCFSHSVFYIFGELFAVVIRF